jgi:hypothetical protein
MNIRETLKRNSPLIVMLTFAATVLILLAVRGPNARASQTSEAPRQFVLIGSYQGIQIYCPGRTDGDEFRGKLAEGGACFLVGLPSEKPITVNCQALPGKGKGSLPITWDCTAKP